MTNTKMIGSALIGLSIVLLILLVFVKVSVDEQGAFMCEAVSLNPDLTMDDCPAHKSDTSWMIMIAFGISFLVLSAGIYMVLISYRKEGKGTQERKIDLSKLDEQEKKVVLLLQEKDGSMYQSDLMKELGVTKVQMTRILDKLEGKSVIDRKRRGMTNIVLLR